MKKQARMAWLVTLALLAPPLGAMGAAFAVSAEEGAAEVYSEDGSNSVSGNEAGTESGTEKVQLDTPTNLRWGAQGDYGFLNAKYCANWEGVNPSIEESTDSWLYAGWVIEVYKDDQHYPDADVWLSDQAYESYWDSEAQKLVYTDVLLSEHSFPIYYDIFESGSYKFRAKACALWDDEVYRDSEWSQWSESIAYVRPEQELGVVTEIFWDTEKAGVCRFTPLENSEYLEGYYVTLYNTAFGDRF